MGVEDDEILEVVHQLDFGQQLDVLYAAYGLRDGRFRSKGISPTKEGVLVVRGPLHPTRVAELIFLDQYGYTRDWVQFSKIVLAVAVILSLITCVIIVPCYISSSRSAGIYNSLNGTNFTAGDFFWAGDQINASTHTVHLK
jgi:hypothetical protein